MSTFTTRNGFRELGEKTGKRFNIKAILTDSAWSIAGLVLMNAVMQIAIFPLWSARLGNDAYGNIGYLIAWMNTLAISMGIGCNYARMASSAKGVTSNRGYNRILLIASALVVPFGIAIGQFGGVAMRPLETTLYILLIIATMWRYYGDVEYRLSLNYRRYFLYYLFIGIGYGVGIGLFLLTGLWPLALLPGELMGLGYILLKGTVFGKGEPIAGDAMREVVNTALLLFATHLISNLIFNGDRFVLKLLLDSVAVTIYYQASLLGKTVSLISTPLNSVLIGYLARHKGALKTKHMHLITLATLGLIVLMTVLCTLASHVIIRLLYPQNYMLVKAYFFLGNLAQVLFFVGTMLTTLLLRYSKVANQFSLNLVYAVAFLILCIPAALMYGIEGFCIGLCIACLIRYLYALFLGYRNAGQGPEEAEGRA